MTYRPLRADPNIANGAASVNSAERTGYAGLNQHRFGRSFADRSHARNIILPRLSTRRYCVCVAIAGNANPGSPDSPLLHKGEDARDCAVRQGVAARRHINLRSFAVYVCT